MAFNSNDLYTVSGGIDIFNYWNPFVTKHDTSSFYNWEQDNLPLYDLEERTYYLWEKFGYPLSGVPSMALVVSASVPTHLALSSNVFTSLSAAIESLPEIIRMPTLIEVAVSGELGNLELNNIKCEDDGALEIINRAFAPLTEWSQVTTSATQYVASGGADTANYTPNEFSGMGPVNFLTNASALSVSALTADLWPSTSITGFTRSLSYASMGSLNATAPSRPGYGFVGVGDNEVFRPSSMPNLIQVNPIAGSTFTGTKGFTDLTIDTLDVSTIDGATSLKRAQPNTSQLMAGIITANSLYSINIQNCDGPIYIRGFIVDGYYSGAYNTTKGIGVYNSDGVVLEDCGATRCSQIGYDLVNSKVTLGRRNLAIRNYDKTTRGTTDTYGFKIVNSDVDYQVDAIYADGVTACFASYFQTYGVYLSNSLLHGGGKLTQEIGTVSLNRNLTTNEIGYNNYGLYCDNSKYDIIGMSDFYNNEINVKGINSEIRVGRFAVENGNKEGVTLDSSRFILNTDYNANYTTKDGQLFTSTEAVSYGKFGYFNTNFRHLFLNNGSYYGPDYPVALSSFPTDISKCYSRIDYIESFGTDGVAKLPSIQINNSKATMPASQIWTSSLNANGSVVAGMAIQVNDSGVCKLIGVASDSGKRGCTNIIGPPGYSSQQKTVGVAALNGSKVYIHGPTVIAQHGIDLLAQDGSIIKVSPILDDNDDSYDISGGWAVGTTIGETATTLELHSTRACAVADKGSKLLFEDLGDYTVFWPTSETSAADYTLGTSLSSIAASGALQFYPNPSLGALAHPDLALLTNGDGSITRGTSVNNYGAVFSYDNSLSCYRGIYNKTYSTPPATDFRDTITRGGVCVKATGGSEVFVRNVHFPTGYKNTDGSFYDPSASIAGCNNLNIWNIQDTSRLNSSYATVSGVYPSLAGYTGPRSFFSSGVLLQGYDSSAVSYGAYSGTPDTGTLSILDHYGSGVEVSSGVLKNVINLIQQSRTGITAFDTYGSNSYENRGPFRLYFPVNPEARALAYVNPLASASSLDNRPYQHLAQGYNLSGAVSSVPDLSGAFPNLLTIINDTSTLEMSGYYYPDAVTLYTTTVAMSAIPASSTMDNFYTTNPMLPNSNNANVWVDQSFSNTFSNAKHCNTPMSGRKRLVNVYRAITTESGEAFTPISLEASGFGLGFKSTNLFDIDRDF